jgi:hypothetical protein
MKNPERLKTTKKRRIKNNFKFFSKILPELPPRGLLLVRGQKRYAPAQLNTGRR